MAHQNILNQKCIFNNGQLTKFCEWNEHPFTEDSQENIPKMFDFSEDYLPITRGKLMFLDSNDDEDYNGTVENLDECHITDKETGKTMLYSKWVELAGNFKFSEHDANVIDNLEETQYSSFPSVTPITHTERHMMDIDLAYKKGIPEEMFMNQYILPTDSKNNDLDESFVIIENTSDTPPAPKTTVWNYLFGKFI